MMRQRGNGESVLVGRSRESADCVEKVEKETIEYRWFNGRVYRIENRIKEDGREYMIEERGV